MNPASPEEKAVASSSQQMEKIITQPQPTMTLRSRFFAKLRDRVANDALALRIVFWDGEVFDFTIALRSRRLMRFLLTGNIARLGQAYVEGEIEVEGRLQDILQIGIALAELLGKSSPLGLAARLVSRLRHSVGYDAAAVRYHYDVSNNFIASGWTVTWSIHAPISKPAKKISTPLKNRGRAAVRHRLRLGRFALPGSLALRHRRGRHYVERSAVRLCARARRRLRIGGSH
jgi:hypothetical protein